MKVLILGGTVFLGRHLASIALERGYEVTLFNRGMSNAELFPAVETLLGDRDGNLSELKKRIEKGDTWDVVIDTSGTIPRTVAESAQLLSGSVGHYTFISSIAVYDDFTRSPLQESDETRKLGDGSSEELTTETFGALKAASEKAAEAAMPNRVLNVRPGLIVGPHDPTDRFTYWPVRIAQGGPVILPPRPEAPVQFIDVRDLAEWTLDMANARQTGTFNASGPAQRMQFTELLEQCRVVTAGDASFHWTPENILKELNINPWKDLPLWLDPESEGMLDADLSKAIAAGLCYRSLATTISDTLEWATSRPETHEWQSGLKNDQEQRALEQII